MRQIVLDTETTGINPQEGHRIIEIGCVELLNRKLTGNTFHVYINPERVIEEEAISIHGITNEFLKDKPLFSEICDDFIEFISGAELVIHNAPFDVGFMDHEFALCKSNVGSTSEICRVLDTLTLAKKLRPGQKNNLDALCKVYGVDNTHRTYHGALLDSEILADVYLYMTGGQTAMNWSNAENHEDGKGSNAVTPIVIARRPKVIEATADDNAKHEAYLDKIEMKANQAIWRMPRYQ